MKKGRRQKAKGKRVAGGLRPLRSFPSISSLWLLLLPFAFCLLPYPARGVQITLLATNISLPSPWTYYTGADAPEGAWAAPWAIQSSVSATVSLGQTLAPGNYTVYFKAIDYDRGNTNHFTLGGATSANNKFDDRDLTTGYWSTNLTVTSTAGTSDLVVNFFRPTPGSQNLLWLATYITSFTNEIVLRDDRALAFSYPANFIAATNKANIIPNSSFECGVDSFWRQQTLSRTNAIWDLWDTNVSYHGQASIRVPGFVSGFQASVSSNPFLVSSNRPHSLSVYAKTTNGTSWATLAITSVYTAPDNLPATLSHAVAIVADTTWQRISFSLTNLPWYPSGEYFIALTTQNITDGNYVFFDALQLEEGDLTSYAPKETVEFAAVPGEPTRIFWANENTNTLTIRAFNNSAGALTRRIDYKIRNNLNALVESSSLNITVGASNTALSSPITLSTSRLGSFRAEFSMTNSAAGNELTFGMVPAPAAGFSEASNIGGHVSPLHFASQMSSRLGVKSVRSLSTGSGLSRWSVVEPSPGAFTWLNYEQAWTNNNMIIMGVLGEDLPVWMTNNNYFRTTAVVGAFSPDEIVKGSAATGVVSYIFYSTNGPGTALQLTNLTGGISFTSGSVTGQSSGATAVITNTVFANGIDWRRYTNYLATIFTHYSGIVTNWEVWNEPDQDSIDMPNAAGVEFFTYAEACRLAAHWASVIDPNIRLIFGGGVSAGTQLSNVWARLGPYTNFYAWSVHHYPGNEADLSQVITTYGKPIWNTETGTLDKGGFTGSRASWRRGGKYVVGWRGGEAMYNTLWENIRAMAVNYLTCIGYKQSKFFYYDNGLRHIGSSDFDQRQFSVFDYDDSIRARGFWLASMGALLGTATGQGRLTLNDASSSAFLFLRGTTPLVSIWAATNKTITLAANVSTSDFKLVDMMGNRTTPGSLVVNFGRMPLLLEAVGALSQSNLTYAVTNGVTVGRTDTTAPTLAIVEHPHITPTDWSAFRWVAIDDLSMPSNVDQEALLYSYQLGGGAWSPWAADTFVLLNPDGALGVFSVKVKDAAGNESLASVGGAIVNRRLDGNLKVQGNVIF